jgi:hypothetical protein
MRTRPSEECGLTGVRNDRSVGNDDNRFLVLGLKALLDQSTALLETKIRTEWDSHEEVLVCSTIGLHVINHVGIADHNSFE